ncbi:hypothetical protein GF337_13920 [candidate division KSB1 bacterium]|nr:hypothetical protein [candidate division KSB1 bacterium]
MAVKRIRDLPELVSRINPDASLEEAMDDFYVERGEESPVYDMIDHLLSETAYAKLLFTGPRGCGKETELLRLANDKYIKRYFHVKIIPGEKDPDKLTKKIVDGIIEIAKEENVKVDDIENKIEAVKKFQEGWTTEAELAGKFNEGEVPDLLNIGNLKPDEKVFKLTRKKADDKGKPPDYLKHVKELTERIFSDGRHRKKDVLILVTNMDKIGSEKAEELFLKDFFFKMSCYAIFTFPFETTRSSKFPEILRKYSDDIYFMPNLCPFHSDGSINDADYNLLRRIIFSRFHRSVFKSHEIIFNLIRYSGGNPYELIRLIKECARRALRSNTGWKVIKPKVDLFSLEEVLNWKRRLYANTFGDAQLDILKEIHRTNSFKDKTNKELLSLLSQNLIFMYGPVSDVWDRIVYEVNPIIYETFPDEFRDSEEDEEE